MKMVFVEGVDGSGGGEGEYWKGFDERPDGVAGGCGYGCISGLSVAFKSLFHNSNKEQKDVLFVELGPVYGLDFGGAFLSDDSVFRERGEGERRDLYGT